MRVTMDGQTITDQAEGVAQAIEMVRERAESLGRLVIEVIADGQPAPDLLDAMPADPAGVRELGVTTAKKSLFLRETLAQARETLERTRADQAQAAGRIDAGEIAEALGSLRAIIEGWQLVRAVVDQAAALSGLVCDDLRSGDEPGGVVVRALADDLVALRDAVSREDWSGLSDNLACDLDARAVQWIGLIDDLAARTTGPDDGATTA